MNRLAIIRVRGRTGINTDIRDTLSMLNLHRKNYCVIVPENDIYIGMIRKVKDYVTYGVIEPETEAMLANRIEKAKDKEGKETVKRFIRLQPPRGGFGRRGIKWPFSRGGALGQRGAKINDLLRRMM